MKMPKTYVSGKIATIIMLQAVFLVGILAFSGGIILHKDAAGPLTDTMLKPGLGGAEVDTDPAAYQRLQGKEQLLAGMLADLKAGRVPEGVTEAGTTKDGQTLYSTTVAGVTLLLLPTGKIAELAEVAPAMQGQVGIIKASSAGQDIGTLSEEAVGELNQMPGFNEEVGNLVGPIQVQSLGEVNRILAERAQGFRYIQPSVVKAGGTPGAPAAYVLLVKKGEGMAGLVPLLITMPGPGEVTPPKLAVITQPNPAAFAAVVLPQLQEAGINPVAGVGGPAAESPLAIPALGREIARLQRAIIVGQRGGPAFDINRIITEAQPPYELIQPSVIELAPGEYIFLTKQGPEAAELVPVQLIVGEHPTPKLQANVITGFNEPAFLVFAKYAAMAMPTVPEVMGRGPYESWVPFARQFKGEAAVKLEEPPAVKAASAGKPVSGTAALAESLKLEPAAHLIKIKALQAELTELEKILDKVSQGPAINAEIVKQKETFNIVQPSMIEIAPMEYIFLVKLEGAAEFIPLYMRFDRGRWIVMHIAGLNRQALASLVTEEGPWKMYLEYLRVKEAIVTPAELKTQIAIEVNQGLMANLGALGRRLSTTNLNYPQQLKALQLTGPTVVAVGGTPVQAIKSTPVALGKMAGELAEPVVVSGEEAPAYYEFETAYATAGHAELAKKAEVRFNIVAIPPTVIVGKEAEEFVKTPVRYSALPIIYQPLTANMLVIMQRPKQPAAIEEGPAEEVVFLVAKPGEPVIVPAGWGHVIVNRNAKQFEETPLFVASWSAEQPSQETTLFAKLGGAAYYVVRTEQGITVSPNYKYLANYGNVPPLKVVAPANVTPLGLEAGKPIYDIISSKGKFARLAYFLGHGAFQLNPQETAVFEEPLPAGEKGSLITGIKKGELVTPKAFREIPPFLPPESKLEELLGPKVTIIKAASAGAPSAEVMIPDVSIFKVEPTEVKLFAGRGEEVTKVSTLEQKAWEIGVLRKIDQLKLAGLIFPEPATTEQAERAKEEIPAIIQQLQPLTTEPAKIIAEAEVAQRVSGEREAIMVPVTAKETVFMIEQPGTYKPVMAMRTIAEEVVAKQSKEERGAILLDFNTLGSTRAKPDGSQVFVPSDYVMKAISLLNALEQTTIGGKPRYHIAVYSNELNADQMRAALGVLASPFTDFIQTPTVAEAVDNIAREQNINPDRVVVTLAQITLQKYPEILGRLAEAVRIAMVATPKAGEYISYKAVLLNSLKLLEGILAPTEITGLRSAIETAPVIRGTTIEPEKDEDKAISRMQAAYAV